MRIWNKIKMCVLTFSVIYLFSLLAGQFIARPFFRVQYSGFPAYLFGYFILLAVVQYINLGTAVAINTKEQMKKEREFKKLVTEIDRIGIRNPLDFSFAMSSVSSYRYVPEGLLFPLIRKCRRNISGKYFRYSIRLFERKFGRKPECVQSGDWEAILFAEAAAYLDRDEDDISPADILCSVSPGVMKYFSASHAESGRNAA